MSWSSLIICSGIRTAKLLPHLMPVAAIVTLLSTIANDRGSVAIGFGLVSGCDLKGKGFVVVKRRATIETKAGNAPWVEDG